MYDHHHFDGGGFPLFDWLFPLLLAADLGATLPVASTEAGAS
jgi:hypothetical protein